MNPLSAKRKRIILWLACLAIFFEAFDVSIVNLALQKMAEDIRISLPSAQWIQTVYLIAFASFLLLGGRLCDSFGSKRIYLTGMFLFGAASAMALISNNLTLVLIVRGFQGIGAALAMPAGISLLSKYFEEGKERNFAMGIFGSFAAIGFAGGLAAGGIITTYLNWHWIFSINIPVITAVLWVGNSFIPADEIHQHSKLNFTSSLWLVATLLLFCYGIHELPQLGWTSLGLMAIAIVSFFLMIRYDNQLEKPFFEKSVFLNRNIIRAQLTSIALGASFLSYVFICTLVLSNIFDLSNKMIGFILFPYSIASALVSKYVLPKLFAKLGVADTAKFSMMAMLTGTILLVAGLYFHFLSLVLISLLCINTFSIATGYPSLTILALSGVSAANQGMAAGLQSSLYSIGSSIGLSVIALCLQIENNSVANLQLLVACVFVAALAVAALVILKAGVKE